MITNGLRMYLGRSLIKSKNGLNQEVRYGWVLYWYYKLKKLAIHKNLHELTESKKCHDWILCRDAFCHALLKVFEMSKATVYYLFFRWLLLKDMHTVKPPEKASEFKCSKSDMVCKVRYPSDMSSISRTVSVGMSHTLLQ